MALPEMLTSRLAIATPRPCMPLFKGRLRGYADGKRRWLHRKLRNRATGRSGDQDRGLKTANQTNEEAVGPHVLNCPRQLKSRPLRDAGDLCLGWSSGRVQRAGMHTQGREHQLATHISQ